MITITSTINKAGSYLTLVYKNQSICNFSDNNKGWLSANHSLTLAKSAIK